MNEEIKIRKLTDYEGGGYLAEYTHLKGCMADGETKIEALEENLHITRSAFFQQSVYKSLNL
jgi:predicted RNase H-like HicB family nuclease